MLRAHASIAARQLRDRSFRCVLAEELLVGERSVVELLVVVLGAVKELAEGWVHLAIVLRVLHVEVADPAQLSVNVPLLRKLRVVGHARPLHVVLLVRVQLSLWVQQDALLVLEVFVEVLL